MPAHRKLDAETEARVRRLLALKVSPSKLARKFNVSCSTIERCNPKAREKYNKRMQAQMKNGPKNEPHTEKKCPKCRRQFTARPGQKYCKNERCRKFRALCRQIVRQLARSERC
jgi:hypothetical protein